MKASTPILLAVAVAAGLLGLGAQWWLARDAGLQAFSSNLSPTAPPPAGNLIGTPAPDLGLPALEGASVRLPADFAGRPLLVNFWASWCAPCLAEMPELERFSREQGDNGVRVVGVALDTPEAVRAFLAGTPVSYPILLDSPGQDDASVKLGNRSGGLPYSVLIDADGRIAKAKLGPFQPHEIEAWATP